MHRSALVAIVVLLAACGGGPPMRKVATLADKDSTGTFSYTGSHLSALSVAQGSSTTHVDVTYTGDKVTHLTYPNGNTQVEVSLTYTDNRLSELAVSAGSISSKATYTYDNGRISREDDTATFGSFTTTSFETSTYDEKGRLKQLSKTSGSQTSNTFYTYDDKGLLTRVDDGNRWDQFTYSDGVLKQIDNNDGDRWTLTYNSDHLIDAIASVQNNSNDSLHYTYGEGDSTGYFPTLIAPEGQLFGLDGKLLPEVTPLTLSTLIDSTGH